MSDEQETHLLHNLEVTVTELKQILLDFGEMPVDVVLRDSIIQMDGSENGVLIEYVEKLGTMLAGVRVVKGYDQGLMDGCVILPKK